MENKTPIDDGGPAYPTEGRAARRIQYHGAREMVEWDSTPHPGMSLRAYIAAHVFAASEASETFTDASGLELDARATAAVRAADALIAALKE